MNRTLLAALLCATAAWAMPATAQTTQNIYRCGDSYSQQPCAGGKLVAASDSRSAAQKSQTDEATKRDAKAAEAMERARVKEEAKPAPVGMPVPKAQDVPADIKKPATGAKTKKPEQFTAVSPKKPGEPAVKKKKKAKKKDA